MNQGSPLWHVNNSFSREDKVAELAAYEQMTRCLNGEAVDRPPNFDIFMTFAVRRTGKTQRAYYLDHRVLVEANMLMLEQFGSDIAQAISDPFSECYATRHCMAIGGPRSFSAGGCEIPMPTPDANVHAQNRALASLSNGRATSEG